MCEYLKFDSELLEFFNKTSGLSKVVDLIGIQRESFFKKEGDFFKKESHDKVSFIPKSKLNSNHSGFDEVKYRQTFKIGKLVKKVFTDECLNYYYVNNSDIEMFVNFYKSFFDRDFKNLKIIEGNDILKYYHEDSYFKPSGLCVGQLWKSCMRYDEKNNYMKIYSENPNSVKMLILLSDDGKLKARALLWQDAKDSDNNSYKVMDRIYSIYDHDMIFFKNWAFENGYIHKFEQSAKTENIFNTPEGVKKINLRVFLENTMFSSYPYIDSFKWFSPFNKTLSNSPRFQHEYELIQNDGSLERFEEDEENEEVGFELDLEF